MIDDDLLISVKQFNQIIPELFQLIGIEVTPDVYKMARDIAICSAIGRQWQMKTYPTIYQDVDSRRAKEDNGNEDRGVQKKEN